MFLSISAQSGGGVNDAFGLLEQNERSTLASSTRTTLTLGLMSRNRQGIMGTAARWEADGVMSVAYYLKDQLQ